MALVADYLSEVDGRVVWQPDFQRHFLDWELIGLFSVRLFYRALPVEPVAQIFKLEPSHSCILHSYPRPVSFLVVSSFEGYREQDVL